MSNHIENLRKIFLTGIKSIQPSSLIFTNASKIINEIQPSSLNNNDNYNDVCMNSPQNQIQRINKNCHIVGFGKAVLGMAVQLEKILDKRLVSGILSVPYGMLEKYQIEKNSVIKIFEGAKNNLPDESAVTTAHKIKLLAESMRNNDVLFVLISGGGSALLPLPKLRISLNSKLEIIQNLTSRGARIDELNIVRIAMSQLKGGKLANLAKNAGKIVSLIISDIVNDPIELIASGPTIKFKSEVNKTAKDILEKYQIWGNLDENIRSEINDENQIQKMENNLENNVIHLIGNNKIATDSCKLEAEKQNYIPFVLSTEIQGNVKEISKIYANFLKNLKKIRNGLIDYDDFFTEFPFDKKLFDRFIAIARNKDGPLVLILGGEPTVILNGNGIGGRNQELALMMSIEFFENNDLKDVCFLSAGTDGIDGPTIAAGAIGYSGVIEEFLRNNEECNLIDLKVNYLDKNDSFTFYHDLENGKYHVITGHTGTNVMDLHLFVVP